MSENRRQRIYKTIMLIVIVATVTFVVTSIINYDSSRKYVISANKDTSLLQKLETSINSITKILDEKYLGDVDEETLIDGALKGMASATGDVYTEYYTKKELEDFTASTLGNFVGIGIYMQADMTNDRIVILETIEGSPAEKNGLKAGDIILKADGVEYKAEQLSELSSHVRGEVGTEVELTIARGEEILDFKIIRESIHINYVVAEMLEDDIGYISVTTFDEKCGQDFFDRYNELYSKGAKKLIIDLRDNGGGLVNEALQIADFFCEKDEITLITVDKDEKETITKSKTKPLITMPVVLLTNRNSASASEILAAALKDNEKAEIVGERTYGKGVIQELVYLSNGGALKVTSSEYYTPKRNKINNEGIEPNYEIHDIEKQLEKAIELLNNK